MGYDFALWVRGPACSLGFFFYIKSQWAVVVFVAFRGRELIDCIYDNLAEERRECGKPSIFWRRREREEGLGWNIWARADMGAHSGVLETREAAAQALIN